MTLQPTVTSDYVYIAEYIFVTQILQKINPKFKKLDI